MKNLESIVKLGSQFCGIALSEENTLAAKVAIIKALLGYEYSIDDINTMCGFGDITIVDHEMYNTCFAYVYEDGSIYVETNADPFYYSGTEHLYSEVYADVAIKTWPIEEKRFYAKLYRLSKERE